MGLRTAALDSLGKAVDLAPDDSLFLSSQAAAYRDTGDLDNAVAGYRKAVELDKDNALAHCGLGLCFSVEGRYDEATACFNTACECAPDDPDAFFCLGTVLEVNRKRGPSVVAYSQCLDLVNERSDGISWHVYRAARVKFWDSMTHAVNRKPDVKHFAPTCTDMRKRAAGALEKGYVGWTAVKWKTAVERAAEQDVEKGWMKSKGFTLTE